MTKSKSKKTKSKATVSKRKSQPVKKRTATKRSPKPSKAPESLKTNEVTAPSFDINPSEFNHVDSTYTDSKSAGYFKAALVLAGISVVGGYIIYVALTAADVVTSFLGG